MKRFLSFMFVALLTFTVSCTNPKGATSFLESQGYTQITITGFDILAKGKDDLSSTGFKAFNAKGEYVKGAVTDKGFISLRPRWNLRIYGLVKRK